MSDHSRNEPFPRKPLIAVAALIGFSLVLVAGARLSGLSASQAPPSAVSEQIDLRFEDRADGAVTVLRAEDAELVAVLAPGSNGFVRGVLRGMARERRSRDVGEEVPFRLARLADGRLTLQDLATGRVIELKAFGPDNEAAFAALLADGSRIAAQ
jgi:putative photosynthetic complex assembly protein